LGFPTGHTPLGNAFSFLLSVDGAPPIFTVSNDNSPTHEQFSAIRYMAQA